MEPTRDLAKEEKTNNNAARTKFYVRIGACERGNGHGEGGTAAKHVPVRSEVVDCELRHSKNTTAIPWYP